MGFTVGQHVRVPERQVKTGETPDGAAIFGALPTNGIVEAVTVHEGHAMVLVVLENGDRKHWHEDEVVSTE